ncbi:MAG: hypothetical protein VW891_16155 [Novosphingobium sp.]
MVGAHKHEAALRDLMDAFLGKVLAAKHTARVRRCTVGARTHNAAHLV